MLSLAIVRAPLRASPRDWRSVVHGFSQGVVASIAPVSCRGNTTTRYVTGLRPARDELRDEAGARWNFVRYRVEVYFPRPEGKLHPLVPLKIDYIAKMAMVYICTAQHNITFVFIAYENVRKSP